ncbi:ATP-dependent Clp protease ATP-binding subunit ClpB [Mycoplasmoides fastidiosum]|uniref:ATP-dependent Clp protease ATP-binding subunit ClpB n=1 Tax=Mycoplasmoides fastidiosum TaxID=92758 RepID=A0ABU0LYD7_9BACT|nr:AAA family ATPase [Mycoplasmoides fastidiosum]MDQ0513699.1 ATP-dependent Clp protease ATP-binding subunit ClpB [Mycoplasmoides fastidiosum]UUD37878.1 AAA family ATPase [Mycoplasmoides fastidiosum]
MDFNFKKSSDLPPLEEFGRNLNKEVANNKIDPVIGRENEIRRLIEIISRKSKNNPILIGEPGVGKTAIVEGFVQRIVAKDVPTNLLDKEVYEISLSNILSGASFQGQFEERMNKLIKQVQESEGKIILFIDEIHQLVGAGRTSGAMDAANILKPLMARGDFKIIGATTLNEYRNYIEKDGALERRMQKILVNEPSKNETITIMRGLKERWELFHGVKILDSAIVAAVNLSDRYITDRMLPDKAIDLIDEAAARIKTDMHSQPKELDVLNREIIHLETERAALAQEDTENSRERLQEVDKRLIESKDRQAIIQERWKNEKELHKKLQKYKEQIDKVKLAIERYQIEAKFEEASKLLYVTLPNLEREIKAIDEHLQKSSKLVKDKVTEEEIAAVISDAIGVPLQKIVESEKEKLLHLRDTLKKEIKGQDNAIELVTNAVLRGRVGINDPDKPIGSFLFLGPTGVGKTEVARALAFALFDSKRKMVRIDMSEYMEKHSISKLVGAPPGYVGYDQAGLLTESVRRNPYSVILLDEIEKAHSDVLNLLLQILDHGEIKDGQGRLINFKNTILILTSNIGAKYILDNEPEKALGEMRRYLRPEFINRLDEIIIFNKLESNVMFEIVKKFMNELIRRMKKDHYYLTFTHETVHHIIERSYDINYGARPIKRFIQTHVENLLSQKIINDELVKEKKYLLDWDKQKQELILIPE